MSFRRYKKVGIIISFLTLIVTFQSCSQHSSTSAWSFWSPFKSQGTNGGGYSGFQVDGSNNAKAGEKSVFTMSGGSPPYRVEVVQGDGQIIALGPSQVSYQTPLNSQGIHLLKFSDAELNTVEWAIRIESVTASDHEMDDHFGRAVQILGDTVLIGAPNDDDGGYQSGSIYIFHKANDEWVTKQKLFVPDSRGGLMGYSLHGASERIIAGAPTWSLNDPGESNGRAYIFEKSGDQFLLAATLAADENVSDGGFGTVVHINGDRAFVTRKSALQGAVYIYRRTGQGWQLGQKLTTTEDIRYFGSSVILTNGFLVVGSASGERLARLFVYTPNSNGQFELLDMEPQIASGSYSGFGSILTPVGSTLLVPERMGPSQKTVHEYALNSTGLQLIKSHLLSSDATGVGPLNSLAANEHHLIVGCPMQSKDGKQNVGAAYMFERVGENYEFRRSLSPDKTPMAYDQFGQATHISGTRGVVSGDVAGTTLIVDFAP
jgi:hypothetical protein